MFGKIILISAFFNKIMAKVKVLIKGLINLEEMRAWPSSALIIDNEKIIITDPGTVKSQKVITDALEKEGLTVNDITHVFITHSHLDHYRNIGMFPEAISIDMWGEWIADKFNPKEWPSKFDETNFGSFSDSIHVIKTPGHDESNLTFFVKGTSKFKGNEISGMIAVCGDVFWKKDFPKLEEEPFATDKKNLQKSRTLVLKNADYIIPGHDDIFKVEK